MHNVTDNIRKISANKNKFHRIGRSVLCGSIDLNFNSVNKSNLKEILETNTSAINLIKNKKVFEKIIKTPILIKDKLGNLPGVILILIFVEKKLQL